MGTISRIALAATTKSNSSIRNLHQNSHKNIKITQNRQITKNHQFRTINTTSYLQTNENTPNTENTTPPTPIDTSQTLNLTESAKTRLDEILVPGEFLRVKVNSGGCSGFQYEFIITTERLEDDIVCDGLILTDETSLELIKGSYVDFYKQTIRSAFGIMANPQATDGCSCGASFSIDIGSF